MNQILLDGKKSPSASGRCVVAGDKHHEWDTSGISDQATSILVVCQRPPECHHCDNASFRQRSQNDHTTHTKRPFAELPLQCLELVSKLGPPYQSHQMQLYQYWAGSSTSIILCHWKCGRFFTGRKRCQRPGRFHGQFLLILHPLQRGCLQIKTFAVYDKAVIR